MPVYPTAIRTADDPIDVVVTRLDLEPGAVRTLADWLSDSERERARRFVFDRDRRRFVVARARLRQLLGARLGVSPGSVELVYGVHGKPALAARYTDADWRFNVSHSEDLAVYAFTAGREVGIDVEAIHPEPGLGDIAARFFSRRENEVFMSLDPRDKLLGFFNCWTRKEAFVKALGGGLQIPLDQFDVSLAPGEPAELRRVGKACGAESGWRLESFVPAPGFVAALAAERRVGPAACAVQPSH